MNLIFSCIFMTLLIISTLGKYCDDIRCANVIDEVCGIAELRDGTHTIQKYQNLCEMRKEECERDSVVEINEAENEMCNINKTNNEEYLDEGRRVNDFSIVGAHQACNHSCPTFCTDSYDPACAQIWESNMKNYEYRPMINHCHIDLFSCASGTNVTIQPLNKCYQNPSGLQFMQNVAMMKSLNFLDGLPVKRRGINVTVPDENTEVSLKKHLKEIVRRLFEKYQNKNDTESNKESDKESEGGF